MGLRPRSGSAVTPAFRTVWTKARPLAQQAAWAAIEAAAAPAIQLMILPLLLTKMGAANVGFYTLGLALSSFGSLVTFGAALAATKLIAEDHARSDQRGATATANAAFVQATVTLLVVTALILGFSPLLAKTLFSSMGDSDKLVRVFVFGVLFMLCQELDQVCSGVLRGALRYDKVAKVELFIRILGGCLIALSAWFTSDLSSVLVVTLLGALIKLIAKYTLAAKHLRSYSWGFRRPSRNALSRVFTFGRWQVLHIAGGLLFLSVDRLIVGAIFGAVDLARYGICMQIAQFSHWVQAAAAQLLLPLISSRSVKQQNFRAQPLLRYSIYGGLLCVVLPAVLAVLARPFLTIWIGEQFAEANTVLLQLLMLSFAVLSISIPVHFVLLATGGERFIGYLNLAGGLLSICASLYLVQFGLLAFASGKLIFAISSALNFLKLRVQLRESQAQ